MLEKKKKEKVRLLEFHSNIIRIKPNIFVMVNFLYQFDWPCDAKLKQANMSGCIYESASE